MQYMEVIMYKNLIFVVICLTLLNCSTTQLYKGVKLAPEETVIIEGESLTNFSCHMAVATNSIKICAFDGVEFDTCQRSVEFLPGEHSFRLELSMYGITMQDKMYRLEFDAGERYCLRIDSYNGELNPKLSYVGKYNKQTEKVDLGKKHINLSHHIDTGTKHALKKHPLISKDLNSNGLFNIDKNIIKQNEISKIITSDFIYKDDGSLDKRNREHILTYDRNGNLILSSGHVDQGGDRSDKFIYDGSNNLAEEHLFNGLDVTGEADVTAIYKNSNNVMMEKKSYNNKGVLLGSSTYIYDESGNNIEVNNFNSDNQLLFSVTKKYDKFNNIKKRVKANTISEYSYKDYTTIITTKFPNGSVHSVFKYTFNKNGTLKGYSRTSGDGDYWDKYVYLYDDNQLPISKVHSKKELVVQDPYEITKYEYVIN